MAGRSAARNYASQEMANSQDSDDIKISFGLDDDDDDNWENLDLDKMSLVRLFPTRQVIISSTLLSILHYEQFLANGFSLYDREIRRKTKRRQVSSPPLPPPPKHSSSSSSRSSSGSNNEGKGSLKSCDEEIPIRI